MVSSIALIMTIGVYGLVAGIVKLDDAGLYLLDKPGEGALPRFQRWWGARLLAFAPWLMKALGVVGTIAMFMVGGGILVHGIHALDIWIKQAAGQLAELATVGPLLAALTPTLAGIAVGMVAGALVLSIITGWQRLRAA